MHRPTTSMMKTEEKIKAVRNRDASYRDKFFVAVRTTKIVCTPDCPAKPLEKNIVFYDTLEEALQAGYRPCKICMKEFPNNKRNNMETIKITRYQSPVGDMLVGSYGDKLCICDWAVEKRRSTIDRRIQRHLSAKYEEGTSDVIKRTIGELEEYFAGHRKIFDIPVVFTGSEFQCTVWEELMKYPMEGPYLMANLPAASITRRLYVQLHRPMPPILSLSWYPATG